MFKGILVIILISSCGFIGISKSYSYSRRVAELSEIRDTLRILNTEISYRKDPLPAIFCRISEEKRGIAAEFLNRCSFYMGQRHELETCWGKAADDIFTGSSLTASDKAIIRDLGAQMGKSSIKGQNEAIMLTEEKLKAQITEALREKNSKGKMYGGLGFSIGIIIAVLLI